MAKDARKHYTFWTHPITLLCIGIATIYFLFQTYGIFARKGYTQELLSKSVSQKSSLESEYEKSQERVRLLETPLGKDMFNREKQNYVEEGEEIYVIVKEANSNMGTTTKMEETWLQKITPFY